MLAPPTSLREPPLSIVGFQRDEKSCVPRTVAISHPPHFKTAWSTPLRLWLQYRLQYEALGKLRRLHRSPMLYLKFCILSSGADGIRTHALRRAKAALSRLSYGPVRIER